MQNPKCQRGLQDNTCICPYLTEPSVDVAIKHYRPGDPGRERLTLMIQRQFAATYGADINDYCNDLIELGSGKDCLAVAGLRPADRAGMLFSEQYLDATVDSLIGEHLGMDIDRSRVIEIGNLAVTGAGYSRWLFAALTALLSAAGYEWVVCTAITPLIGIFQRIGLEPVILGNADPARLAGDAESWGRYYEFEPKVCFGSISMGYQKMNAAITSRQPRLQRLWDEAHEAGKQYVSQGQARECVNL